MMATAPSTIGPTILHPGPTRAMTDSAVHADKFKSKRPPAFWRHATLPVLMALAPHPAALRSLHYVHVERVTDLLERMYISLFCVRRSAQVLRNQRVSPSSVDFGEEGDGLPRKPT